MRLLIGVAGLLATIGCCRAQDFQIGVGSAEEIEDYISTQMVITTANTDDFRVDRPGKIVTSRYVQIGTVYSVKNRQKTAHKLYAHASFVVYYNPTNNNVNIDRGGVHITTNVSANNERCQVFETATCNCHKNKVWNFCQNAQMVPFKNTLVAQARIARLNAAFALQNAGFNVVSQ